MKKKTEDLVTHLFQYYRLATRMLDDKLSSDDATHLQRGMVLYIGDEWCQSTIDMTKNKIIITVTDKQPGHITFECDGHGYLIEPKDVKVTDKSVGFDDLFEDSLSDTTNMYILIERILDTLNLKVYQATQKL